MDYEVSDLNLQVLCRGYLEQEKQKIEDYIQTAVMALVSQNSIVRRIFAHEKLKEGAQASYPIADDFELPIFILPGLGYVPQNFIEGVGDEVFIPTFRITSSFGVKIQYCRLGGNDIFDRAIRNMARTFIEYEEEAMWRLIIPAATTAFPGKGLLSAKPAPICQVSSWPESSICGKSLVEAMYDKLHRNKRSLTHLFVSRADIKDLKRAYSDDIKQKTGTKNEYILNFTHSETDEEAEIEVIEINKFGAEGLYNINHLCSSFGIFRTSRGGSFNGYQLRRPNIVSKSGAVLLDGETQIYGMDLTSSDSFVMPIRQDYKFWEDPNLFRNQEIGYYGWIELGMGILDPRPLVMGVIDRSDPEKYKNFLQNQTLITGTGEDPYKCQVRINGKLEQEIEIDVYDPDQMLAITSTFPTIQVLLKDKEVVREVVVPGKYVDFSVAYKPE